MYVADNPVKDFIAPNQIGMHSLRIKRYGAVHGKGHYTSLETEPEFEISSLTELKSILKNEFKNKKVLVTGADGFIGSHLVESLMAHGAEVKAFTFTIPSIVGGGWILLINRH